MTVVKLRTFAHANQPMPGSASGLVSLRSWPVVEYLDLKFCGSVLESNGCRRSLGVLTNIGQRLLDDPVGGHFERRRQRPRVTTDRQAHVEVSLVGIVDQISQLSKARLGCQFVGVTGSAKESKKAVELGDCSAAGVFD
jgi:hypothetical protein